MMPFTCAAAAAAAIAAAAAAALNNWLGRTEVLQTEQARCFPKTTSESMRLEALIKTCLATTLP